MNGRLVKLKDYVPKIAKHPGPVVMVVGAVAKGDPGSLDMKKEKRMIMSLILFVSQAILSVLQPVSLE